MSLDRIERYRMSAAAYDEWLHAREAKAPETVTKHRLFWEFSALPRHVKRSFVAWAAGELGGRVEWQHDG